LSKREKDAKEKTQSGWTNLSGADGIHTPLGRKQRIEREEQLLLKTDDMRGGE